MVHVAPQDSSFLSYRTKRVDKTFEKREVLYEVSNNTVHWYW